MRRGLTFGKFMPLHRGHQLLIDTALADSDDLTIVVYDSQPSGDYDPMPIETRLGWLRELYPQAENILAVPDPRQGKPGNDDPIHAIEYADALGFLGRFDRVYTSEPHYERFAQALGARHIVVDPARRLVPISGTAIRENLYEQRAWLDPRVYASLVRKVVFVGTESTGKTTLARTLAAHLDTLWVHEYGRELWERQNLAGSFMDHLKMAQRQHDREEAARRQARRFLFCDTNAWTTLQWSLLSYGTADARLVELAERTLDEYSWIFCADDFGWIQDGTRELTGTRARAFQTQQEEDLKARGISYLRVTGSIASRTRSVLEYLQAETAPAIA